MRKTIKKVMIAGTAVAALLAISIPTYAHTVVRVNFGVYGPGYYGSWRTAPGWHHHRCHYWGCGPHWHYRWHHGYYGWHRGHWSRRWY